MTVLARLVGQKSDTARRLGFSLPAGGEFAFVLFTLAARERLLTEATADLLILAVTLSMMLGPLLIIAYEASRGAGSAAHAAPTMPSTSTTCR